MGIGEQNLDPIRLFKVFIFLNQKMGNKNRSWYKDVTSAVKKGRISSILVRLS